MKKPAEEEKVMIWTDNTGWINNFFKSVLPYFSGAETDVSI